MTRGLGQELRPTRADGASADVKQRLLGRVDHLRRFLDRLFLRWLGQTVARQRDGGRIIEHRLGGENVLRQVNEDRTGKARAGNLVRGPARRGEVAYITHQEAVRGDAPRDADDVALLEGVITDERERHLSGQYDDRHGVHVRVGDTGDGVRGTRTAGNEDGSDFARCLGVAFGGVGAALLVADEDVPERRLEPCHFVVNLDDGAARVTEDNFDAFSFERADENTRSGK